MKIPMSFELMGETITVKYIDDMVVRDNNVGVACYSTNEIQIQSNSKAIPRNKEQLRQTFLHELVHFILMKLNKLELNKDEAFVDSFADLLLQFEKSSKGEVKG